MKPFLAEPYRLFFPLGFLLGLWGVTLWALYALFGFPYPGIAHSYLMIGGFLTAFTTGFMMTAIPRFTGTFHADAFEIGVSLLGLLLLPFSYALSSWISSALILILHVNLIYFFARRFLKRRAPMPLAFLFIPLSLAASVLGQSLMILTTLWVLNPVVYSLGRTLAFHGFMLGIALGVGSKIIPAFTGHGPFSQQSNKVIALVAISYFGSFFVQQLFHVQLGLALRFAAVLYIAIAFWKIHQRPANPSRLSYGIWISCWGTIVGLAGGLFFPQQLLAWNHVLFIGGLSLMTFMIGSRVVIAHGGFDLSVEGEKSWVSFLIGALVLTSLLRWLVNYWPLAQSGILFISSILWIFCLIFWWLKVGAKTLTRLNPKLKKSCS